MENNNSKKEISRRKFLGNTAAIAAVSMMPVHLLGKSPAVAAAIAAAKPDSNFGGVKFGAITYSWRSMPAGLENIVKYCVESGISNIELMSGDLETFLGAPKNPAQGMGGGATRFVTAPPAGGQPAGATPAGAPGAQGGGQRPQRTPEQIAAAEKYAADLKAWRVSVPMSKVAEARKLVNDAGIDVHIVKFSPARWSDEEIDYAFKVAKAMGAKGVCDEISEETAKKLAPFAEKHGMYAILHNHMQFATPGFSYDPILAVSKSVMMNFDMGHFFGSTGIHPNTIIEKYHERIISVHMKDKTGPKTDPANMNQVWGQGEAPISDVLLLLKKEKWPIYADIELEYEIKPWSNQVKETATCIQYARNILM